jgi:hypothetical protein
MVVSALVVTLAQGPVVREVTLARLSADPRLMVGEPIADRVPVVAEVDSTAAGVALVDELGARAGIARVDVVSIVFEDPDAPAQEA